MNEAINPQETAQSSTDQVTPQPPNQTEVTNTLPTKKSPPVLILSLLLALSFGVGGYFAYVYFNPVSKDEFSTESTDKNVNFIKESESLRVCPDEWIKNQMPKIGDDTLSTDYFILNNERREVSEFDLGWVENNCNVEIQIVY